MSRKLSMMIILPTLLFAVIGTVNGQLLDYPYATARGDVPRSYQEARDWNSLIGESVPFNKTYSFISAATMTDNGDMVLVGCRMSRIDYISHPSSYISIISANGEVKHEPRVSIGSDAQLFDLCPSDEGGALAVGRALHDEGANVLLVHIAPDGEVDWTREIVTDNYDSAFSILRGSDGCYYVSGYTDENGDCDILLMKLNDDASLIWRKAIPFPGHEMCYKMAMDDAGLAMMGTSKRYEFWPGGIPIFSQAFLVRTDFEGNVEWSVFKGADEAYTVPYIIQGCSDGGYAMTGFVSQERIQKDIFFIRVDAGGDIMAYEPYEGLYDNDDYAYGMVQLGNGKFLLLGRSCHWVGDDGANAWLVCDSTRLLLEADGQLLSLSVSDIRIAPASMPYIFIDSQDGRIFMVASTPHGYSIYRIYVLEDRVVMALVGEYGYWPQEFP